MAAIVTVTNLSFQIMCALLKYSGIFRNIYSFAPVLTAARAVQQIKMF